MVDEPTARYYRDTKVSCEPANNYLMNVEELVSIRYHAMLHTTRQGMLNGWNNRDVNEPASLASVVYWPHQVLCNGGRKMVR